MTVRMRHAESGGTYDAAPSQVPLLELSGWQTVEGEDLTEVVPLPPELQLFEGQQQVRLHHPETGAEITVAESAVPFHRERGWLLADEGEPETDALDGLTVEELRDELRARALPVSGTKTELVERLRAASVEEE